jgi:hypothetical protein
MIALAVLVSVRFVLQPILNWQAEVRDRLQIMTSRLDKSNALLTSASKVRAQEQVWVQQLQQAIPEFPEHKTADTAKLAIQKTIETEVQAAGVQLDLYVWLSEGEYDRAQLSYARGRFIAKGPVRSLIELQVKLEADHPYLALKEVSFGADSMMSGVDEATATMTVVFDSYYRTVSFDAMLGSNK